MCVKRNNCDDGKPRGRRQKAIQNEGYRIEELARQQGSTNEEE